MNAPLFKAFYGRDDKDVEVEFEIWKEEQEWLRKNDDGKQQ